MSEGLEWDLDEMKAEMEDEALASADPPTKNIAVLDDRVRNLQAEMLRTRRKLHRHGNLITPRKEVADLHQELSEFRIALAKIDLEAFKAFGTALSTLRKDFDMLYNRGWMLVKILLWVGAIGGLVLAAWLKKHFG